MKKEKTKKTCHECVISEGKAGAAIIQRRANYKEEQLRLWEDEIRVSAR